ncbi:hypothetical protein ISN44_As07g009850 [Arabidopsis suecica]|uniref:DUF1985 domain-containing protein n=1 Tax=Arabidopsis suecica TaxID=45249 RepID=A0A8T2BUP4_ARASU|nr:hypothetical protein ISN44_As07g009850 [Arabidopsis suecica]
MANLALSHRMFRTSGEPDDKRKINIYFVLKYMGTVKEALKKHEKEWSQLCNSQFRYLLEHGREVAFLVQFAHYMLSHQLVTAKKHEIWKYFGGAPIRFSIQEFSDATGIYCSKIPEIPQNLDEDDTTNWDDLIGKNVKEIDDT